MSQRKIVPFVAKEELKKLLGGCFSCGWKRKVIVFEENDLSAKITCKAVQDAKVFVRPLVGVEEGKCDRKDRTLKKRARDDEYHKIIILQQRVTDSAT